MVLDCWIHGTFNEQNITCDCSENWENLNEFTLLEVAEIKQEPCGRNINITRFLFSIMLVISLLILFLNAVTITRRSQLRRVARILIGYILLLIACTQKLIYPSHPFGTSTLFFVTFSLGSALTTTSGSYIAGKFVALRKRRLQGGPTCNENDFIEENTTFCNSKSKIKRLKKLYLDLISTNAVRYTFYCVIVLNFLAWIYYGANFHETDRLTAPFYIGVGTQLFITLYSLAVPAVLTISFVQDGRFTIEHAVDLQPLQTIRFTAAVDRIEKVVLICVIFLLLDILVFIVFLSFPAVKELWTYFWPVQIVEASVMVVFIAYAYRANRKGSYKVYKQTLLGDIPKKTTLTPQKIANLEI